MNTNLNNSIFLADDIGLTIGRRHPFMPLLYLVQ
jgi:hypothetical protein